MDVSHLPMGIVYFFVGDFQILQGTFVLQLPLTNHGCLGGHVPLDPINDVLKLLILALFQIEVILDLGKTSVEVGEAKRAIAAAGAFKERHWTYWIDRPPTPTALDHLGTLLTWASPPQDDFLHLCP
jgi:hypothetical protein